MEWPQDAAMSSSFLCQTSLKKMPLHKLATYLDVTRVQKELGLSPYETCQECPTAKVN